jgi:transposase
MSLKEIAAFLKLSGMRTRKGKEWHPEQVKRLIRDYRESRSRSSPEQKQAIRQIRGFIAAVG